MSKKLSEKILNITDKDNVKIILIIFAFLFLQLDNNFYKK